MAVERLFAESWMPCGSDLLQVLQRLAGVIARMEQRLRLMRGPSHLLSDASFYANSLVIQPWIFAARFARRWDWPVIPAYKPVYRLCDTARRRLILPVAPRTSLMTSRPFDKSFIGIRVDGDTKVRRVRFAKVVSRDNRPVLHIIGEPADYLGRKLLRLK